MSWQVSLYIGILYFCLGLAVLNTGVFNSGLSPAATVTTSVSTLILQPIPTGLVAGYLPYKPSALPWFDDIGTSQTEDSRRKERYRRQGTDAKDQARSTDADDLPDCQTGKKSCRGLGRPEICCDDNHTCLLTNNTLIGVYCCRSPDPIILPCDDTNLKCEPDWYQCPTSVNGGCCEYGQSCGLLECYDGDGPTALTTTLPPITTTSGSDISTGGGIIISEKNTVVETTIGYTSGTDGAATITSTSTSSRAIATIPLTTNNRITTTSSTALSETNSNSASITYIDSNRLGASNVNSAGSRAKVGGHWSWAVMVWWIVAAIAEGL